MRARFRFWYTALAAAVAFAVQSCVPPPPVHHFIAENVDGTSSTAWTQLPPSEIVRITAQPAPSRSPPAQPDAGFDFTDCDTFLPAGVMVPPGTPPTLFSYRLDSDGSVHDASLIRSSGIAVLDKAALTCAEKTPRQEAMVAGKSAQISWTGEISWAYPRHGFVEPSPDGGSAGACGIPYPSGALSPPRQGDTIIGYRIGMEGKPHDETVIQSSGSPPLDRAARDCSPRVQILSGQRRRRTRRAR